MKTFFHFLFPSSISTITSIFLNLSIALLLPGYGASALTPEELLEKAATLELANEPIWRKLIHFEAGSKNSVVLTPGFFLSTNGQADPEAELKETIISYFLPWNESNDNHPRCRFPARYFWLAKKLELPNYTLQESRCQKLEKWALFSSVKSISVFLVGGYLGNPASTFGHALLKLNTDSVDDKNGLFDLTINYGALVPENELVMRYVTKGIFGGYQAGFSDKYFYTEDLVYTRTEFRDIWDYKLNLTEDQRTLLILHIWEIVGNKFDYYFLDRNCAFRLAELLELVIDEDLLDTGLFWYLPVELFYRLNEIDRRLNDSSGRRLLESVTFRPSSQRLLYTQLRALSPAELEVFNSIIENGPSSIPAHLQQFPMERQIVILDCLLAYQQYRFVAEQPDPKPERQQFNDQILLARLKLPPQEKQLPETKPLPSPADGSRPMALGFSGAVSKNKHAFLQLNWSPFKQETVGQNSLEGDDFTILDLKAGFFEDEDEAFLDQLDIIRILNLKSLPFSLADEQQLSWQLRVGSERVEEGGDYRYDGIFSFGAGKARAWNDLFSGYLMLDTAAHTLDPYLRLRPHLGLTMDFGATRAWLFAGGESADYQGRFDGIWGGKLELKLTKQTALKAELSNERATQASLGAVWYF